MQIAKRVFSGDAKTLERKARDMALALQIERTLTKDQIFEFYVNEVYFGSGAYGIGAAADVYFGKTLDQLTVAEAALIARCVRRPSDENPYADLKTAVFNRNLVLDTMLEEGWISPKQHREALDEPVRLRKERLRLGASSKLAPYFVDFVFQELKRAVPEAELMRGGYRVVTTLDYELNEYAEAQLREWVRRYRGSRVTTGAFVVLGQDGQVLAMVGGRDYKARQFNAVTQGQRQPGSAFKPFIYAAAFDKGVLSPYGSVSNAPFMIRDDRGVRRPISGGGKGGSVSVRSAMAMSINTPACWAIKMVGYHNAVDFAKTRFGFSSELPAVPTLALGSGSVSLMEMAVGYSVFQSGGDRVAPYAIVSVTNAEGETVYTGGPSVERLVLSSTAARGVDMCLRAVVTSGTGRAAGSVRNARGKTGTTSDNKDAWFCGYTDRLIGVGWVGNEYETSEGTLRYGSMSPGIMGGYIVAPLWARIVGHAQAKYPEPSRSHEGGGAVESGEAVRPRTRPEPEPDLVPEATEDEDPPATTIEEVPTDDTREQPVPSDPPPDDPPPGELVVVEVCADTGARASAYCPERSRRRFAPGSEPRGRCPQHKPPG
jgi:penicillin-binding protein 1A